MGEAPVVFARSARQSPLALALGRFARNRGARWGARLVAAMVAVAVFAPLIASDAALMWWDDRGLRLPLIAELFNRNVYGKPHDLFFNVAAVLSPLIAGWWWWQRRRWSAGRRAGWAIGLIVVGGILAMVPMPGVGALWARRPDTRATYLEYRDAEQVRPGAVMALFAPIPHSFQANYPGTALRPPITSVNPATGQRFWMGTDSTGRDVAARMAFGARVSLTIGVVATFIAMAIGVLIGGLSGYVGGWVDLVLQRLVEIMLCFPTFILVLTVMAMVSRDIFMVVIVIGLTGWAGTARLVRGEFLAHAGRDYVLAGQALGLPRWRIMFRHILPNVLSPLLISATFGIAGAVGLESGLAFLGLGDPNAPTWGQLLDQGREKVHYAWLIYIPGLAVFLLVMALNLVGNGLREAFDPRSDR